MEKTFESEKNFSRRVKAIREFKQISQSELSRRCGIHQTAISKIESGDKHVSLEEAIRLSGYLGVTIDEMVSEQPVKVATIG